MNNNFITPEQSNDLSFIKDIIKPEVGIVSAIERCSDACNTFAYLVNKHIIIKFAKNDKKMEKLILERKALSFLKGKTTLKIPETSILKNNFMFSMHEIISGETLDIDLYNELANHEKKKFCCDIALFMYEIHSLTNVARKMDFPQLNGVDGLYPIEQISDFLTKSNKLLPNEQDFVAKFCHNFKSSALSANNVFGHFDIQPKNIAFDFVKNEISGIYDFGDCGFCDINYDFAKLAIQYSPEVLRTVLKEYRKLSGLKLNIDNILAESTYCVLYCLMRDIENGSSTERGLYELQLRMI